MMMTNLVLDNQNIPLELTVQSSIDFFESIDLIISA